MNHLMRADRRQFLKNTAGASLAAGIGPLLAGCGGGGDAAPLAGAAPTGTENRTYFFDLSNADPETDFFLVSGTTHHPLRPATATQVVNAKGANLAFQSVGNQSITHIGETLALPSRLQMCFVKGVSRSGKHAPGEWDMHSMFYHVPAAAASLAAQSCGKSAMAAQRFAYQACLNDTNGILTKTTSLNSLAANNSVCTDPAYDQYKDYFDQAMALVCHHPEIGSFDATTLSYVQQAIVCADLNLLALAASLYRQGPATTAPGGWATLVEYTNPVTGKPQLGSKGDKLYFTHHSAETLRLTGTAINSILPKVKNDPLLGANITGLAKTDLNAGLQGKMWVTRNGTPTRPLALQGAAGGLASKVTGSALLNDVSGPAFTARDVSSGNGYRVDGIAGSGRTVTFTVDNWYLRYLGLYIRFLDGAGHPIAYADLPSATKNQFVSSLSGTFDCFLSIVNQELVILGIPIKQNSQTFTVTLPASAASMQILAGGLGSGTNDYPETVRAGAVMTVLLDLAVPGLFLAMSAVQGYASLSTKLAASTELLVSAAQILILAVSDGAVNNVYKDASAYTNLAVPLLAAMKKAPALYAEIQANMEAGEAEGAAEDAIPFGIGLILQAVLALASIAQMAETSAEIANAPWTFLTQVDATHNLTVAINHDPADTAGFPATATYYTLRAVCDGGSPAESGRIAMQATTRTAPLSYTFNNLPAGGKVTVTVAFYSDTDWLAGAGSTGAVNNSLDTATITIKENLVPLTPATQYSHKQKLGRNSNGQHIWIAGPKPAAPPANCNNVSGGLCNLQGISVSETFGNVGYVWRSYSQSVSSFGGGAAGQQYQFANISFTEDPESSWLHSGGGFPTPPRLAYSRVSPISQNFYIDTSTGQAIVRRINMTAVGAPPTFDSPRSNLSVGSFNFASDAFLIHPTGKLISINAALGKLEVLVPAARPVADARAPLAQAFAGPGSREGLLNGPACAVVAPSGAILVLEQGGNRVQAFDTGANPTPFFAGKSTMQLKAQTGGVQYLDMAIEFVGYLYVLSFNSNTGIYSLDIYTPAGVLLATTSGMNASKLAIDLFRNVYTLNFETIQPVSSLTEPSVSQWIPSTP